MEGSQIQIPKYWQLTRSRHKCTNFCINLQTCKKRGTFICQENIQLTGIPYVSYFYKQNLLRQTPLASLTWIEGVKSLLKAIHPKSLKKNCAASHHLSLDLCLLF